EKKDFLKMCRVLNEAEKVYKDIDPYYEKFTTKDLLEMNSKKNILIIEINKKILGLGIWSIKNKKICWISILHIKPNNQKTGLGSKLIKEIEKRAIKNECKLIMLEIFPKANWAKNFYLKNDYKILLKKEYNKKIFKNLLSLKAKTTVMIKIIKKREKK
ncbi:GNAT family N-acetyltransferase, partial [Patescibacteria group bacterium]|nr:GNAT family N-acetyltransferase [Patescibacteria group bacterium]